MKKIFVWAVILFIVGISLYTIFHKEPPSGKTAEEIRLEKELKKMIDKYRKTEKEKDQIFIDYLAEKNKKPKVIFKEKIITKEIDSELWIKKIFYDDLKLEYLKLELYVGKVEDQFEKYRLLDSISIKDHDNIVNTLTAEIELVQKNRDKWRRKAKRRVHLGFHSGMNIQGHFNISAGINFKLI